MTVSQCQVWMIRWWLIVSWNVLHRPRVMAWSTRPPFWTMWWIPSSWTRRMSTCCQSFIQLKPLWQKKSRDHPCCACCLIANLNSHTRRLPSWPDASWMPGARLCWPRRCPEWHPLLRWQGNCVCPWCASGSLAGKEISGHSLLRSFWDSNFFRKDRRSR